MWVNEGFGRAGERVGEEGRAENGERARRATGRGGRDARERRATVESARGRARARLDHDGHRARELPHEDLERRDALLGDLVRALQRDARGVLRAREPLERALHRLRARQVGLAVRGVVVVARHVHRAAALLLVEQLAL
jgi:hypothetical protein